MWFDLLDLLVTIGLLRADYKTRKSIEKINAENKEKGVKKKYVILPSTKFILIIILVLLTTVIFRVWWFYPKVAKNEVQKEMTAIKNALCSYKTEFGCYPVNLDILIGNRPLRKTWKQDKWNNFYMYKPDTINGSYQLVSAGKDGKFNSEDDIVIGNK